jgi:hypothetical protein
VDQGNSVDRDLFGDPIPEGFGGRGRPPHLVTDRNRNKVMVLLAVGWAPPRIAATLGVSMPTLKKHYFRELRSRDVMLDRLKALHMTAVLDGVRANNIQAVKEMGRLLDRIDAARFGIGADRDDEDDDAPPRRKPPVGKKELAAEAARSAGEGSDWGQDLLSPSQVN